MIRLLDTLALGLPAAAWGFWLFYEDRTPLDIDARLTFPLLVAAELTAWRCCTGPGAGTGPMAADSRTCAPCWRGCTANKTKAATRGTDRKSVV